jgi:exodeoxyribonuclease VII large subunit
MGFMMTEQKDDLRTIRQTNERVRAMVETKDVIDDYFWIGGEVSRTFQSHLGHTYFTIGDEGFSIDCMLPNRNKDKSDFVTNGAVIDVYGVLRVYQKQAKLQIIVENVRLADSDSITFDPEVLEKLKTQNLFPRRKRDLPKPPKKIVLITSKNSQARDDFVNTFREQGGIATIQLLNTPVQGKRAAQMIVERINEANHKKLGDVIVIIRGGGRNADLDTYNDYGIAEAICRSQIPIVTGIGHQRNETIADRVADESTITPTDAAYKLAKLGQGSQAKVTQRSSTFSLTYIVIGVIIIIVLLLLLLFLTLQT